jgi:hypothetical protein
VDTGQLRQAQGRTLPRLLVRQCLRIRGHAVMVARGRCAAACVSSGGVDADRALCVFDAALTQTNDVLLSLPGPSARRRTSPIPVIAAATAAMATPASAPTATTTAAS